MTPQQTELAAAINTILDDIDWEAIKRHMVATEWKWRIPGTEDDKIPTFALMRATAKRLLQSLAEKGLISIESGGFRASATDDGLTLEFILTSAYAEMASIPTP